jgi:hypothetical protein
VRTTPSESNDALQYDCRQHSSSNSPQLTSFLLVSSTSSLPGNSNTVGGGLVLPLADLGDLSGMEAGSKSPIAMVDGEPISHWDSLQVLRLFFEFVV